MTTNGWRLALVLRYPELFDIDTRGVRYRPGYPAVSDGWRDIVETAVARIAAASIGHAVEIEQVKEKYGSLRIYWIAPHGVPPGVSSAIDEATALAEARSECTCETCGAAGRLYTTGSWDTTSCPEHARGVPVPVRPGFENLHIVRVIVEGEARILACRRYDRDTDTFVDVDPAILGKDGE